MTAMELLYNDYTGALEAAGLKLYYIRTLEDTQAIKMVEAAKEPIMRKWVPGDTTRRFLGVEAAQHWFGQDSKMVFAIEQGAALSALAWFSQKPSLASEVEAEYTYAIRLYQGIRGQGLAPVIMAATHAAFYRAGHSIDAVWLATDSTNTSALRLYTEFGYRKVKEAEGRVYMVLPPPQAPKS